MFHARRFTNFLRILLCRNFYVTSWHSSYFLKQGNVPWKLYSRYIDSDSAEMKIIDLFKMNIPMAYKPVN